MKVDKGRKGEAEVSIFWTPSTNFVLRKHIFLPESEYQ